MQKLILVKSFKEDSFDPVEFFWEKYFCIVLLKLIYSCQVVVY